MTIDEIVKQTLDVAEFTLGFDRADICLVEGGCLKLKEIRGAPVVFSEMPLDGPGIKVRAARTRSAVRVSDTRRDAGYVDGKGYDWKGPPTSLSELSVPVIIEGQTVAVLNVESNRPNKFTENDQTLLETLALHAASEFRRLASIEAVRDSEQRFRGLLELVRVGVCVLDGEGNVRIWNKGAEEISGYSREEVTGHGKIWEWLYPEELYRNQVIRNAMAIITNRLYEENLETKIRRKDGQTRFVTWNFHSLVDQNDQTTGSVVVGRDITEQIRMQDEIERRSKQLEELVEERTRGLTDSEARLNAIVQSCPEGVVVLDPNGRITECNQAALQLFDCPSKDLLMGRDLLDLVAENDRGAASSTFTKITNSETLRGLRYTLLRSDSQEFPSEISLSAVEDVAGSPIMYVTIIRDLTEQNEMQERLRKAERFSVMGETVTMVGHDLRSPMQGISTAAYLLRKRFSPTDPQTAELLGLIESNLRYANDIVNELLDYTREIHLELTETTPKAVTEAALEKTNIPINVKIRDLTQYMPSITVDLTKTQRVFLNLISNAIDAMPDGGQLTITSSVSRETLELRFSDTGSGMDEAVMRDLWKPLKTTKSKGMGLGLAICKRIVEAHGGSIEVESARGKGSTFTVKLPIKPKTSTSSGEKARILNGLLTQ